MRDVYVCGFARAVSGPRSLSNVRLFVCVYMCARTCWLKSPRVCTSAGLAAIAKYACAHAIERVCLPIKRCFLAPRLDARTNRNAHSVLGASCFCVPETPIYKQRARDLRALFGTPSRSFAAADFLTSRYIYTIVHTLRGNVLRKLRKRRIYGETLNALLNTQLNNHVLLNNAVYIGKEETKSSLRRAIYMQTRRVFHGYSA